MNRTRKYYKPSDMLRIIMLGAGILVTVLASFSICLQSLQVTEDLQKNPRNDMLIAGIFILVLVTVINLRARSLARRSDLKK